MTTMNQSVGTAQTTENSRRSVVLQIEWDEPEGRGWPPAMIEHLVRLTLTSRQAPNVTVRQQLQ